MNSRQRKWFGRRYSRELTPFKLEGEGSAPVLISAPKDLAACYVSLRMLEGLFKAGGTFLNGEVLVHRVESALPNGLVPLLENELELISQWIDRMDLPVEESDEALRFVRKQNKDSHKFLIQNAIVTDTDLRCEYFRAADERWVLDRGTPLKVEDEFFILERTDGISIDIYFEDLRWLMNAGSTEESHRATVLSFPKKED